jgi:hypothetical protein
MEAIMKPAIKSLVFMATTLFAVTSSSAQTLSSTAAGSLQAHAALLSAPAPARGAMRNATLAAPSSPDGLLTFALGASLVAIQLRRRQKSLRTPLLRN